VGVALIGSLRWIEVLLLGGGYHREITGFVRSSGGLVTRVGRGES
jgi:hypothetical protein